MNIIWSPLALKRVRDIATYIADDNPAAAEAWVERLFGKVTMLKQSPRAGRQVPELARAEIRELIFGNYRIIYRLDSSAIAILTVRHNRQILPVEEVRH